ncbi:MAG: hypothetical protein QM673_07980, partial [Gordonia sp. (in: high G+C Gram-positive bacteria)]
FAANPAFRAAEWSELTTPGNPYRRPVRPDDLKWVKYDKPMTAERSLRLSALLGHRMLRNIYDHRVSLVPPVVDGAVLGDRAEFYATRARINAELARPVLERHLFAFLDEDAPEGVSADIDAAIDAVAATAQEIATGRLRTAVAAERLTGRREAAVYVLVQYHGMIPAVREALGRAGIGEFPAHADAVQSLLLDSYRDWVGARSPYRELLSAAGLSQTPGAQWQLVLGTSLGRGNHLLSLADDGSRLAELLGAAVLLAVSGPTDTAQIREVVAAGLPGVTLDGIDLGLGVSAEQYSVTELARTVIQALVASFGTDAVSGFRRGFAHAARFRELWDADLATQIAWADQIELHKDYAEKIAAYLDDNQIVVDLDTFVESEEETSTTHVHNEHRLVMIEKGQMHFWNNVTHKIELETGDKILIPISRLHGSTVLSGECTYHQPIIPDELLQKII